ncbi:MAG: hypothetical protein H0U57_12580 [Tatlockia sp.]|nr:hypothetical protein [Tatlockia sp.]
MAFEKKDKSQLKTKRKNFNFRNYLIEEINHLEKDLTKRMSKLFSKEKELNSALLLEVYNGTEKEPGPRDIIKDKEKLVFKDISSLVDALEAIKQGHRDYTLDDRLELRWKKLANSPEVSEEKKVIYVAYLMHFDRLLNIKLNELEKILNQRLLESPFFKRCLNLNEIEMIKAAKIQLRLDWDSKVLESLDKASDSLNKLLESKTFLSKQSLSHNQSTEGIKVKEALSETDAEKIPIKFENKPIPETGERLNSNPGSSRASLFVSPKPKEKLNNHIDIQSYSSKQEESWEVPNWLIVMFCICVPLIGWGYGLYLLINECLTEPKADDNTLAV